MLDLVEFRRLIEAPHSSAPFLDMFDKDDKSLITFFRSIELDHKEMFLFDGIDFHLNRLHKKTTDGCELFMKFIRNALISEHVIKPEWSSTFNDAKFFGISDTYLEGICVIPSFIGDGINFGKGEFYQYMNRECDSMKFYNAIIEKTGGLDKANPYNVAYIYKIIENMDLSDIAFIKLYYNLLFEFFSFGEEKFKSIFEKSDELIKQNYYYHYLFIQNTNNIRNLALKVYKIWKNKKFTDRDDELILYTMILILSPYFIINNISNEIKIYAPFLFVIK